MTCAANHWPPAGAGIPRRFDSSAAFLADMSAGSPKTWRSPSARSAASRLFSMPLALRPPNRTPGALAAARASLVRRVIQCPLFFSQGGVDVQHERIGIRTKFGHDERDAVFH
jgi:hypothetical protein